MHRFPFGILHSAFFILPFRFVYGKLRRVQPFWRNPFFRSRYLLAALAGLTLAAAFPKIGIAGLGWVAPGLMAAVVLGRAPGERFRIGYVAGLSHYLAMLYWLLLIPYRWHGVPLGPATGWLALSAFAGLFPASWVCLTSGLMPIYASLRQQSPSPHSPVAEPSWTQRTLWALAGAAIWVAMEMILARIFGGFPWDLLGVSQHRLTPLIQIASVTGVYGVSFLMVWFGLSLVSAGLRLYREPGARGVWLLELFLPILVVALVFNFGFRRVTHAPVAARSLKVILVQPSVPQTLIWDSAADEERFRAMLRLSEEALNEPADLLVWPEAGIPKPLRYDQATYEAVTGLARRHRVWMIVGTDDAERQAGSTDKEAMDYYNASFLISPEGELVQCYRKRNLVIFGEYLPFTRWLPFLKWFTPIQSGFATGDHAVPFPLTNSQVQTSVLICFEDTFPHLGRDATAPDTDFLVNITNDGWFGESAEQWQHAMTALFRAVENGIPLVRCANNGITCWIDEYGRLRDVWRDQRGSVYGPGSMTVAIPVSRAGGARPETFYHRYGDWFGWSCVMVTGAIVLARILGWLRRRRAAKGAGAA